MMAMALTMRTTAPLASTDSARPFEPSSAETGSVSSRTCVTSSASMDERWPSARAIACADASHRLLGELEQEMGSRLSFDEWALMLRHGHEPFSWED